MLNLCKHSPCNSCATSSDTLPCRTKALDTSVILINGPDCVWSLDDGEKLQIYRDFNGDVGAGVEGFEGVHGGFWFGKRNADGEMMLEFGP